MHPFAVMSHLAFIDSSKGTDSVTVSSFRNHMEATWRHKNVKHTTALSPIWSSGNRRLCGQLSFSAKTSALASFPCGCVRSFTCTHTRTYLHLSQQCLWVCNLWMQICTISQTQWKILFDFKGAGCAVLFFFLVCHRDNKAKLVWVEYGSEDKLVWNVTGRSAEV